MSDTLDPKRFVVVGAGGIGSWLIPGLCAMAEYKMPGSQIVIIDGDEFEPRNLERQNFTRLGNKAEVIANDLVRKFEKTTLIPQAYWVVSDGKDQRDGDDDNVEGVTKVAASRILKEGDIVIPVVDNFSARKTIMDAAKGVNDIDVITGGNDENLFGNVYHYQRRDGNDVTSHPVSMHPEYNNPPDRNPGEMSCQQRAEIEGGTQLIASNLSVAAIILSRIQHCIIEGNSPIDHTEIYFDWALGGAQGLSRTPVLVSAVEEKQVATSALGG